MSRASTARKALILLAATLLSLVAAELVARWWMPGPYEIPALMTMDGRRAPMAEGLHYLHHYTERAREPRSDPRGRLPSAFRQKLWYDRPTWDYFDDDDAIVLQTNRLGFHDREFTVEKPESQLRVMALGDSFTFALGVPLELSWPQRLEAMLGGAGRDVEVINAGWPNTAPPDYLEWFRTDGIRFEPDVVLVGLCLNDMAPVQMLAYPTADPEPWLGGISVLLNHVQREIEQRRLMAMPRDHAKMIDADPNQWRATQAAILEIRRIAAAAGAEFGLCVIPMVSQLGEKYPYLRMHEMAAQFAAEHEIPCVDLLPLFRGRAERDLWVHPTDQHPNHVGQELIAEGVRAFLESQGWAR